MPNVKSQLSTGATFGTLPVKVSQKSFNQYIRPYLRLPRKGPRPKLSAYKIFNYILYVLHTGCQWRQLPIYRNEIRWQNIHKWHLRWSRDGSYENLFLHSVDTLHRERKLDLSILHGDGSNAVAKKGGNT